MGRKQVGAAPSNPLDAATKQYVDDEIAGVGGGGPDLYPRKSGQYYTTTQPIGSSNTDGPVFGTAGTRGFLTPFAVTHSHGIDRLGIAITTAGGAGSFIRMGVYPHDPAFGTVNKIVSGSVASDSTGEKSVTVSATLDTGFYWLFVGTTDTAGTLVVRRANGQGFGPLGGGISNIAGEWALRYDSLTLTSDAPASINLGGSSAFVVNDVPIIWVRKT